MKKTRTYLIDPLSKMTLYVMLEKDRERVISKVAEDVAEITESGINSVIRRIETMEEMGLISEKGVYEKRYIKITEKGKKIVEKLKEIDEILEE